MRLPEGLRAAIEREVQDVDRKRLARAAAELTRCYRSADFSAPPIRTQEDRAAYLTVRLPATYAANWRVFSEIRQRAPEVEINSVLDLASGPGTALFAAAEMFPTLRQATLMESDAAWLDTGRRLAASSSHAWLRQAAWRHHDLQRTFESPAHDLVVISYSLGELASRVAQALLHRAWSLAGRFLVVIEPGTTRGFGVVHGARSLLISENAQILAPCPHSASCPMAGTRDWCHFSQRLERTSAHRQAKTASLAYEDEKFSYLVASRATLAPAPARIVRHPRMHSGHVQLMLCARSGQLQTRTVARSDGPAYKLARQAEWGDAWPE